MIEIIYHDGTAAIPCPPGQTGGFENAEGSGEVHCYPLLDGVSAMLMLLGLSFGLYKFDLSEKTVRIGILAVYIISTFAGGFAMGKMGKTRKFLRGFMLGMLYFLLLLAISAGIYRSVQGGMQMMIAWILCGAGGMLGGMVS